VAMAMMPHSVVVKKMRLGVKRVKEANAQKLLKEFELVAFKEALLAGVVEEPMLP
jgi:hypothetical protein